jgi:hypothetical protein
MFVVFPSCRSETGVTAQQRRMALTHKNSFGQRSWLKPPNNSHSQRVHRSSHCNPHSRAQPGKRASTMLVLAAVFHLLQEVLLVLRQQCWR